jgi:hypothetical protein
VIAESAKQNLDFMVFLLCVNYSQPAVDNDFATNWLSNW